MHSYATVSHMIRLVRLVSVMFCYHSHNHRYIYTHNVLLPYSVDTCIPYAIVTRMSYSIDTYIPYYVVVRVPYSIAMCMSYSVVIHIPYAIDTHVSYAYILLLYPISLSVCHTPILYVSYAFVICLKIDDRRFRYMFRILLISARLTIWRRLERLRASVERRLWFIERL